MFLPNKGLHRSIQGGISSDGSMSQGSVTEMQLSSDVTSCHQNGGMYKISPVFITQLKGSTRPSFGKEAKSSSSFIFLKLIRLK